jgi:ATP-dependent exoDNAse (exonuclease V) beta subunit
LLYVAMTRAESHLVFAAGESPNTFIEELPVDLEGLEPNVQEDDIDQTTQAHLQIAVPTPDGPVGHSPHTLMRDDVFEDVDDGRGTAFGTQTHEFAERYVLEGDIEPSNDDERHIKSFIDSFDGELRVEEDAYLPLTIDGEQVTISGIVDLVHLRPDAVEIIDFKTDLGRHAEDEYRKQLSVYYHVLNEWFSSREVTAGIFYTAQGVRVDIDPLSKADLVALISQEQRSEASILE